MGKIFAYICCFLCLFFYSIAGFYACKDSDAPGFNQLDASQIEGLWRGENPPNWYYYFSDGMMHRTLFTYNVANVVEHFYGYETRQDSIFLRDMHGNTDRVLTVLFESDSAAILTDVTNVIHTTEKIKRF